MRHGMSSERRNRRLKRRRKRLKKRIPDLLRTGYPLLDYTGNKMGRLLYIYDFQPSFRSFDLSHLDASESIIKFLGNWSHFLHSTWEADLFTVVYNFSYRRDYGSSSAKSTFCEIFYLIKLYISLLYFQSKIMLCHIHQRTSCDRRKNC